MLGLYSLNVLSRLDRDHQCGSDTVQLEKILLACELDINHLIFFVTTSSL